MLASRNQALKVMEILILNGAGINSQNKRGRTALMMAVKNGRKEAVELLLNQNADIQIRDIDKKNALAWAEWHKIIDIVVASEIMELLLDSETFIGAVVNDSNVRIRTKPTTVNSRTIGSLDKGDKVSILGKSEKEEKILNMTAPWYKIKTEDGTVGYSYGYFFDVSVPELRAAPTF